jgi:hypothetical protein
MDIHALLNDEYLYSTNHRKHPNRLAMVNDFGAYIPAMDDQAKISQRLVD